MAAGGSRPNPNHAGFNLDQLRRILRNAVWFRGEFATKSDRVCSDVGSKSVRTRFRFIVASEVVDGFAHGLPTRLKVF